MVHTQPHKLCVSCEQDLETLTFPDVGRKVENALHPKLPIGLVKSATSLPFEKYPSFLARDAFMSISKM